MDLYIKFIENKKEIEGLYLFLKERLLDYPNYEKWLEKCFKELIDGDKKAVIAKYKDKIIGNIIFQKHKENSDLIEMKNGMVIKEFQKHGIMKGMYNILEDYARNNLFKGIIFDTRLENSLVINVFTRFGFKIINRDKLYSENNIEVILYKELI